MDYEYGSKEDQVDEFFVEKKAWSRVKDTILAKYIDAYLKTIQDRNRPILLVDGFAGPGRFGDDSEGSPLIVLNAITKTPKHKVGISAVFADSRRGHRTALESNIGHFISAKTADRPLPDCASAVKRPWSLGTAARCFSISIPTGSQISTSRCCAKRLPGATHKAQKF